MAHKPAKLDDVDLEKVEEMAGRGMTHAQIAAFFGVSQDTFTRQKKRSAEFADAIKRGQSSGIDHVASALRTLVDQGNPAATIFFLKAQAGWRDSTNISVGGDGPNQHKITVDFSNDSITVEDSKPHD